MQLHIPTMFVVIIATTLVLALSIAVVTRQEDHDGLRPFIAALGLHSLAYVLFALRGRIPDALSIWVANVAVAAAYALTLQAIADFQQRRLARWKLFAPIIVIACSFALLAPNLLGRVAIGSAVFLFQTVLLLQLLISGIGTTAGRGQYLVISGVALNIVAIVVRCIVLYTVESETVVGVADAGLSQSVMYLSAFVALNLAAIGFVLMLKEHADEGNRRLAVTDPLTGCWNRSHMRTYAQMEMARRRRYGEPVSILMIDIDFFKQVNDRHGHLAGDRLLSEFADTVRACLREADQLGRWGGEEFVVLLPSSDAGAAAAIGERIRRAVASTVFSDGLHITVSLGFAESQVNESLADWIGRADVALYAAKETGRNRVEPRLAVRSGDAAALNMVRIVWKPEYETGNETIDSQHRSLFERANRLLDTILRDETRVALQDQAKSLLAFSEHHFETEETLLVAQNSLYAAEHARSHRHLLETASHLLQDIEHDQFDAADFLDFFVNKLILQHILIDDRRFSDDLREE